MSVFDEMRAALAEGKKHYVFEQDDWCGTGKRVHVVSPLVFEHDESPSHRQKDADAYAEGVVQAVLCDTRSNVDPNKPPTVRIASRDAIVVFVESPPSSDGDGVRVRAYHYDAMKTIKRPTHRFSIVELGVEDLAPFARRRSDPLFGGDLGQMGEFFSSIAGIFETAWRNSEHGEDQVVGDEGQSAGDIGGDGGDGVGVHPLAGGESSAGTG